MATGLLAADVNLQREALKPKPGKILKILLRNIFNIFPVVRLVIAINLTRKHCLAMLSFGYVVKLLRRLIILPPIAPAKAIPTNPAGTGTGLAP